MVGGGVLQVVKNQNPCYRHEARKETAQQTGSVGSVVGSAGRQRTAGALLPEPAPGSGGR